MACPYFYPVRRHARELGAATAIWPLGEAWSGVCRAAPGTPREPDEALLRQVCYLGYARGRCEHFPPDDAGPDAVRFVVSRDAGESVTLHYVLERDHHPFAHGSLQYSLATRCFDPQIPSETLGRQAEAYAESYLGRRTAGAAAR